MLENRPEVLRRRIEHLRTTSGHRPLTEEELAALAESSFRLGVHRATDPATALELLARAHRIEPTNPRYPYHIGRIHLEHGHLDPADDWLSRAAGLFPTSHRIQAHLSLVNRLRHERAKADPAYDDGFRRRAEEIAATIREGRDDFEPGETPTPLLRPGECRWSGIHDLEAEVLLQRKTGERTRDVLALELERIAGAARSRRGGTAAFVTLAVQWVAHGYPVATVRRLAKEIPDAESRALALLHLVCELFEVPESELPARLAECLGEGALPDLLVAVVHRRRLFPRPLRFPDVGAHTAAREFTDGDPSSHVKAMEAAHRTLTADPPASMKDVAATDEDVPPPSTLGSDERLFAFERVAQRLAGLKGEARDVVRTLTKTRIENAEDFGRVSGDHSVLGEVVELIEKSRTALLDEMLDFKNVEPAGLVMPFEEFDKRVTACDGLFQDLPPTANFKTILNKLGKGIERKRSAFATVGATPSPIVLALRVAAAEMAEGGSRPDEAVPNGIGPTPVVEEPRRTSSIDGESVDPVERVRAAIAAAEQALDDNYAEAWKTLDAYPARLRHRHAVVLLRRLLGGLQAETDLRLRRDAAARRRWNGMLADDPLHSGVLRNLAVAHTSVGDTGPATHTWNRYLESLYLHDVLAGDARRGAPRRAEVHRTLAGSFGTALLCPRPQDAEDRDQDAKDLALTLASVSKAATATAHLRLEELNVALSRRSPTLLLGVARSVGETRLAEARDRRLALAESACAALPARVREGFLELCRRVFADAYAKASSAKGRIRGSGDEKEEEAHAGWARERLLWKLRIAGAVLDEDAEWFACEYSGDVIGGLALIDAVPLDPDDESMRHAVRQLGVQSDPVAYLKRRNRLSEEARHLAFGRIVETAKELGDSSPSFLGRFPRIFRSWTRNETPEECISFFDDPRELYHRSTESAVELLARKGEFGVEDRRVVEAALPALERWIERLPGSTGPARTLALLLGRLGYGSRAKARRVLEAAASSATAALGRREVAVAFVRLELDGGNHAQAAGRVRCLIADGVEHRSLRGLLIEAYDGWIKDGTGLPTVERLNEDFGTWQDPDTVWNRRYLAVALTIALHRERPDRDRLYLTAAGLRSLHEQDEESTEALYHLTVVLFQFAHHVRQEMRSASGSRRKALREMLPGICAECAEYAGELAGAPAETHELSDEQRGGLRRILAEVRPA